MSQCPCVCLSAPPPLTGASKMTAAHCKYEDYDEGEDEDPDQDQDQNNNKDHQKDVKKRKDMNVHVFSDAKLVLQTIVRFKTPFLF